MTKVLDRPADQCVGRNLADLLPESQRTAVESLVAHAATTMTVVMRVLEFPGPGAGRLVCLVEARLTRDPEGDGEQLLWVHSLNAGNDLGGLVIPFRLAAKAANLGVCMYSPQEHQLEWLGGAPALAMLFPEASVPWSSVVRRVHPDDRGALRRLVRSTATRSPWITLRFFTEGDGWHLLACQARRVQLGYGGPLRVFGVIRDDTKREARRRKALVALSAARQRAAEIAAFSSALITAATEQEVQQVLLTRLAATFGGTGAALALVAEGRLCVSSDAGIPRLVAAVHGVSLDDPSPLPYAIRTGKPQFMRNQEEYIRRWPRGAMVPYFDQLESGCAVSIASLSPVAGQPLGGWAVTYDGEHHSSPDERALMSTLADLAGQALKRVRSREVRVELAMALQESMLPTLPKHLPGLEATARYRPSRDGLDIGGDWYDAFVVSDGAIAFEIGDAQGHDVNAAAAMGQVRASMRAIAACEPDPATVLTRTNDLLVTMDAARFASCTMLYIDPCDGRVTGSSAGHVPLLYVWDDGRHRIRELPGGPVLGVLADADYRGGTFSLDKNAALIMVTDGLVEGPSLPLEAGLERVATVAAQAAHDGLNTEETADRILDTMVAVDHIDDAAVLIIRRA
ncbi:SpoIIE family protein phosphatase [Streptomyces sp. SID8377]|nr:SpoIIE family protein phosphatase [Streptomyces sp. SID8377]